jgi:hypothetical protein
MNWDSFFDDPVTPDNPFTIWKRLSTTDDLTIIDREKTIFEGYFFKAEAGTQELKERYFILKPNYLLYRKVGLVLPEQRFRRNQGVPPKPVCQDQDFLARRSGRS